MPLVSPPKGSPFTKAPEAYVSAAGLKLRTKEFGTGEPLLLINGLGACCEGWEPLATRLEGKQIIMVDHPGTGVSEVPQETLTMSRIAAMYMEVLDAYGISSAHILGFSFGGTVAQQIAKDFPDRVRSIVLLATSPGWGGAPADPFTLMIASNPMRYQFTSVREMSAPLLYRGRVGREPDLFANELKGWSAHRASLMGVYHQVAAYSFWSSLPWLSTLRVPALVMGGSEDPMAPAVNAQILGRHLRTARVEIIHEGGHMFPFDRAADTAPIINDFHASLPKDAVA